MARQWLDRTYSTAASDEAQALTDSTSQEDLMKHRLGTTKARTEGKQTLATHCIPHMTYYSPFSTHAQHSLLTMHLPLLITCYITCYPFRPLATHH